MAMDKVRTLLECGGRELRGEERGDEHDEEADAVEAVKWAAHDEDAVPDHARSEDEGGERGEEVLPKTALHEARLKRMMDAPQTMAAIRVAWAAGWWRSSSSLSCWEMEE
jgi:hypothetical protein